MVVIMCMCCVTHAEEYDLLPKVWLVKATQPGTTRMRRSSDEIHIKPGMYGLVICNDPFVWFDFPADPEPPLNERDLWFEWAKKIDTWVDNLVIDPVDGYSLIQAMLASGYNPEEEEWSTYLHKKILAAIAAGPRVESEPELITEKPIETLSEESNKKPN